jgi:nuclear protein NHN1
LRHSTTSTDFSSPIAPAEPTKRRISPPKDDKKDKSSSEKAAAAAKIKSTRREELLKQLKAVEDAIARKKSKI